MNIKSQHKTNSSSGNLQRGFFCVFAIAQFYAKKPRCKLPLSKALGAQID